jgi:D-3-phosphoglycerate dehydrogenase
VPLIDETRDLISTEQIARMPSKAVILNFAREGIVDERAVVAALDASRLSAYVSDFPTNLTHAHPRCVTFPHLGASTDEAEENCAIMVADEVRDFLEHGHIHNSVNFPEVELPRATAFRIICATSSQSTAAAQIADAIRQTGLTVAGMASVSRGDLSYLVADLDAQPGDDLMRAIGGVGGVLMARRL